MKQEVIMLFNDEGIVYNVVAARRLGVEGAIILGALANCEYFSDNFEFNVSIDFLEKATSLSKYKIMKALKTLTFSGIVRIVKKGLPAMNYYSFDIKKLKNLLKG